MRDVSELVPAKILKGNLGLLGELYLWNLLVRSQRNRNEKLIHPFVAPMGLSGE